MMYWKRLLRYIPKAIVTWRVIGKKWGWSRSFLNGRPFDGQGIPIPWYTFPAIEFLNSLDLSKSRVFEYGCGNSSIFWAERACEVVAVENDLEWLKIMRNMKVLGLTVMEALDRQMYINAPAIAGGNFDVVIIDGRFRRSCAEIACKVIKKEGIIIFDNADWYPDACNDLRQQGWFQIDFSGLGPINSYAWTTAVFLRTAAHFSRRLEVSPIGGDPRGRHEQD